VIAKCQRGAPPDDESRACVGMLTNNYLLEMS